MGIIDVLKGKKHFTSAAGVDLKAIQDAEKTLGLCFAEDYKEYLLTFGIASYRGHELSGICKSDRLNVVYLTQHYRDLYAEIPTEWYVIEQTNIDGIIIWQDQSGIIYESVPRRRPSKINNTLTDYICSE